MIGDSDGVTIVPLAYAQQVAETARQNREAENAKLARYSKGCFDYEKRLEETIKIIDRDSYILI